MAVRIEILCFTRLINNLFAHDLQFFAIFRYADKALDTAGILNYGFNRVVIFEAFEIVFGI